MYDITIAFYHATEAPGKPVQEVRLRPPIPNSATDIADGLGWYLSQRLREIISDELVDPPQLRDSTLRAAENTINQGPLEARVAAKRSIRAFRRWAARNSNSPSESTEHAPGIPASKESEYVTRVNNLLLQALSELIDGVGRNNLEPAVLAGAMAAVALGSRKSVSFNLEGLDSAFRDEVDAAVNSISPGKKSS